MPSSKQALRWGYSAWKGEMQEYPHGGYVKYDDYAELLTELLRYQKKTQILEKYIHYHPD